MSEERFDRIDREIVDLTGRFDRVDQELGAVHKRFDGHDARFDALDQRIGVLHEDLIRRIAGVSERDAVSRKEFREAIVDLTEKFGRRLDPLEASVRAHSAEIATLKRRR